MLIAGSLFDTALISGSTMTRQQAFSLSAVGATPAWAPSPGSAWVLQIAAGGTGTVQLERSFDGGVTWQIYSATADGATNQLYNWTLSNASEGLTEDVGAGPNNVLFRLNCTAYTSGSISGSFNS